MIILVILCLLALLWLFLVFPHLPRRDFSPFLGYDYAHRGLWTASVPENSLPAFSMACREGFGIELDVQMTLDGVLAVFHDDSLERMCGEKGRLQELKWSQVRELRLLDSEESIPSLDEVLALVNGRVPLIVEIKTCAKIADVCEKTARALDRYPGVFCVESFDPRAVRWFRRSRPSVIRGQLAYGLRGGKYRRTLPNVMLSSLMANVLGRPDFIAFDADTDRSLPFRLARRLRPYLVAWTVKDAARMRSLRQAYDLQIFEGFVPAPLGQDKAGQTKKPE